MDMGISLQYDVCPEKKSSGQFFGLKTRSDTNRAVSCRRNLVLTNLLAFAIDFWMLLRYIPEHFGIFSEV